MADFNISPNMNLPIPVVGVDPGPDFATNINNSLTLIDQHNHAAGSGVQINPSGININSDLLINQNNLTVIRSVRFSPQSVVLTGAADLGCLFEVGVDLYYNDGNGNNVRITQSGGVAGSPGSISNLTSPASASYVAGDQTFVWESAASTSANMDFGSAIFRNITANSNGITVSPPGGLASNYTLTLPALPSQQSFMTLDASGNMAAPWTVDNSTLQIASSTTVEVKPHGIGYTQFSSATILNVDTSTTPIGATLGPVIFTNINSDTSSGYNVSTGEYTIPATGIYQLSVTLGQAGTSFSSDAYFTVVLYKNGSSFRNFSYSGSDSNQAAYSTLTLVAESFTLNDVLQIQAGSNIGAALDGGSGKNYWQLVQIR